MPILGIMASQISGHLWAPEGAYDALATVTLSASTASVSFVGIPSGYKHLQVRGISRVTSGNAYTKLRFNNDSSSIYTFHSLFGSGSAALTDVGTGQNGAGAISTAAGSLASGIFAGVIIDILDYANTNKNKTILDLDGFDSNGGGQIVLGSGLWVSTAAITQIDLIPSASTYAQYSQFALFGVK